MIILLLFVLLYSGNTLMIMNSYNVHTFHSKKEYNQAYLIPVVWLFSNDIPRIFRIKPKNGQRIEITWLPMNNARPNKNCYIGSIGTVEDSDKEGFVLRYDNGASLIVGCRRGKRKPNYRYKILS